MASKILFFTKDSVPTEAERDEASQIVGNVVFRNAKFAGSEPPEACEGVAGAVPANYKIFERAGQSEEAEPCEAPAKPKIGRPRKVDVVPTQTPLIPAESGWQPNA